MPHHCKIQNTEPMRMLLHNARKCAPMRVIAASENGWDVNRHRVGRLPRATTKFEPLQALELH